MGTSPHYAASLHPAIICRCMSHNAVYYIGEAQGKPRTQVLPLRASTVQAPQGQPHLTMGVYMWWGGVCALCTLGGRGLGALCGVGVRARGCKMGGFQGSPLGPSNPTPTFSIPSPICGGHVVQTACKTKQRCSCKCLLTICNTLATPLQHLALGL